MSRVGIDLNTTPFRVIDLAGYTGDAWAQPDAQVTIPPEIMRLRSTDGAFRWRMVPYVAGVPVDGDGTTIDMTIVKLRKAADGSVSLARTATVVEVNLAEQLVGKQYTEDDISPAEVFVVGVVSITIDAATELRCFADAGAGEIPAGVDI